MVHLLGAQMQNVSFVEICFTSQTDFIVVWYLVSNNYRLNKNQFNYEGNIVTISHIWEITFIVFALGFLFNENTGL